MNNAIPSEIKSELDEIKNDVRSIKNTVEKLLKRLYGQKTDDVTPHELMYYAARGFNVTSKKTDDDDNVANPKNIKPVDWSSYA
jgi:hypothetical protein